MSLTKVSYSMVNGAPINVLDYGADPTGQADSYEAFVAALAAGGYVYVPLGTYKLTQTLSLTGDKVLTGPESSSSVVQFARINFTGTGNCFQSISAEFGGVSIRNFDISGGDGSSAYAIYNTRPQSIFENLLIENWNNNGIALEEAGTGSQASWSTLVRQVKYIAPATATPYRGFQVAINGGHVTLDGCVVTRGSIGINIDQGEAINIWRCSTNLQCNTASFPFSSLSRDNQCGIRLSGDAYKSAISIRHCYIEGFTYGIYVEACQSLSIEDNYIADVGIAGDFVGVPGSLVYLKPDGANAGYIQNVTVRNNQIVGTGNGVYSVVVGDNANHIEIYNNDIAALGTTGNGQSPTAIYKQNGYLTYNGDNRYRLNPYVGVAFNDANKLLADMFWTSNTWTAEIKGSSTAGTYQIASQNCTYSIIGRQITLNAYITMASSVTGGGSGNLSVDLTLLAIPTKTGKRSVGSAMLGGVDYTTAGASISTEADGTTHPSLIWFAETADATNLAYVPITGVGANDVIAFTITYEF